MGYHIGDCPKCGARLIVNYEDANKYEDIDLTDSNLEVTYIVECWKCGSMVRSVIASNIDETVMEIKKLRLTQYAINTHIKTRNLEKPKGEVEVK